MLTIVHDPELQLVVAPPEQVPVLNETSSEKPGLGILPKKLTFGVISAGFYYNLRFSVQNNTLTPVRIKIHCTPVEGEQNSIRLVRLPDRIAPGMSIEILMELTAEIVGISMFNLQITQSADPRIYSRTIEANIVSPETFKYVRKSLQLQKRPIYRKNITSVGLIIGLDGGSTRSSHTATSLSETLIMDDDDIADLLDLPIVQNVYWDPFEKKLRIDPEVGRVSNFFVL
jgi:hypothetical protein